MENLKQQIISELLKHLNDENTDSLEIGTAGRGGCMKIYCNFTDLEGTKAKISHAVMARRYANNLLEIGTEKEKKED